jgi:hypothetical protein
MGRIDRHPAIYYLYSLDGCDDKVSLTFTAVK